MQRNIVCARAGRHVASELQVDTIDGAVACRTGHEIELPTIRAAGRSNDGVAFEAGDRGIQGRVKTRLDHCLFEERRATYPQPVKFAVEPKLRDLYDVVSLPMLRYRAGDPVCVRAPLIV